MPQFPLCAALLPSGWKGTVCSWGRLRLSCEWCLAVWSLKTHINGAFETTMADPIARIWTPNNQWRRWTSPPLSREQSCSSPTQKQMIGESSVGCCRSPGAYLGIWEGTSEFKQWGSLQLGWTLASQNGLWFNLLFSMLTKDFLCCVPVDW